MQASVGVTVACKQLVTPAIDAGTADDKYKTAQNSCSEPGAVIHLQISWAECESLDRMRYNQAYRSAETNNRFPQQPA
jgi:hypothetical protein